MAQAQLAIGDRRAEYASNAETLTLNNLDPIRAEIDRVVSEGSLAGQDDPAVRSARVRLSSAASCSTSRNGRRRCRASTVSSRLPWGTCTPPAPRW